jgi:CDP-diacylglycerol---glycerol-3-phosphate 3-phosphatidyltransferase
MKHLEIGISSVALPYILIFLLGVSELSDIFDGYLARKYNQVTDLGKILDPMADSISRISVYLTFTQGIVQLPMLLVFVFLYRDSVVGTLRTICALRGFALAARQSGKVKAVIQAVVAFCILVLMIPQSLGYISASTLQLFSALLVSVAGLYTVYSGIDYIYENREYVKKLITT